MMKAMWIHDYGGPDLLGCENAPIPVPGSREVLVRLQAAGVNPADRQMRAGLRDRLEKPLALTLGFEVSGVVEERGADEMDGAVGVEVYGMLGMSGGRYPAPKQPTRTADARWPRPWPTAASLSGRARAARQLSM